MGLDRPTDLCVPLLLKVGTAEVGPLALVEVDGREGG